MAQQIIIQQQQQQVVLCSVFLSYGEIDQWVPSPVFFILPNRGHLYYIVHTLSYPWPPPDSRSSSVFLTPSTSNNMLLLTQSPSSFPNTCHQFNPTFSPSALHLVPYPSEVHCTSLTAISSLSSQIILFALHWWLKSLFRTTLDSSHMSHYDTFTFILNDTSFLVKITDSFINIPLVYNTLLSLMLNSLLHSVYLLDNRTFQFYLEPTIFARHMFSCILIFSPQPTLSYHFPRQSIQDLMVINQDMCEKAFHIYLLYDRLLIFLW